MEKFNKQFFKNTLNPMSIQVFAYAIQYLFLIVLAKILPVPQFGAFSYALLINTVLAEFIALGTDTNSKHFFALYVSEHAFKKIALYISWNAEVVLRPVIISMFLFIIMFIIIDPLELIFDRHLSELAKIITAISFTAPFFAISNIFASFLLCDHKVKLYLYFYSLQVFLIMIIAIVGPMYLGLLTPKLDYVLKMLILASIINAATAFFAIKYFSPKVFKAMQHHISSSKLISKMKTWDKQTKLQLINNFLLALMIKIDYIILFYCNIFWSKIICSWRERTEFCSVSTKLNIISIK